MDSCQLSPRRPYLLRAFYDWLLDNQLTPHLVVDITIAGVFVPLEYASNGQIVLNIAPRAVHNLAIGNEDVRFGARFGGVPRQVIVPLAAVQAIYAKENGAGTLFEQEAQYLNAQKTADYPAASGSVVSVIKQHHTSQQGEDNDPPPPPSGNRPRLRIVK